VNTHIFKALIMNPVSITRADFYDPGYLVVRDGRIQELTAADPRPRFADSEFHDLSGFTILPGFIDAHVHLPQFAIMGVGGESLLEWLNNCAYPEEMRFSDPEYALRISEMFFDALLTNGTTCACIYCSVHEGATDIAFEVASRKGIRAFIGKTMMTRSAPPSLIETEPASIRASVNLWSKWDGAAGGRLRYVFTPRFAGACSMDLMRQIARIAGERQAFIQSHLSENTAELEWIQSLFPERASYTDVYAFAGLLGERTIMAHCIHLSDEEISLLASTRTNVAFCPYSNRTLRSGPAPFDRLKRAGLRIGLGSDVGGGPSLSMLRQMGEALNTANASGDALLSPAGALYLATLAGAAMLGFENQIGNFAPQKDADFIVIDHKSVDPLCGAGHYNNPEHILSRLCYNGDAHCVKDVYIRGSRIA
jgi:guanine deaminase